MPPAKFFLLNDGSSRLQELIETPYQSEDLLQAFLADHCDLLPGELIDPQAPRRWLLISRELGVPDENEASDRWFLDHLLVDQSATPTFVECKRSTDTRGRREVVAQMIDYAAFGSVYWPIDRLRQAAAEVARQQGRSLDEDVLKLIVADNADAIEVFWRQVEENLRTGRVRLVFVADKIPKELLRLVEFLDAHMPLVEVLAVEVRQFLGPQGKVFSTSVVSETTRVTNGGGGPRKLTTQAEFLAGCQLPVARFFEGLLAEAEAGGCLVRWNEMGFSLRAALSSDGKMASFLYGYSDHLDVYLRDLPPDASAALRRQLLTSGFFKESGQFTLVAQLREDILGALTHVASALLDKVGGNDGSTSSKPVAVTVS
jgi:hypothetical protein